MSPRSSVPVSCGFGRVEQAAVGGVEARLRDRARGVRRRRSKVEKRAVADARKRRAVLQTHPRLGDDAEDALGAEQHAVGRRARARAGQAPALPHAARRDRADRLDEVVDVRVQRRVVTAGARREPAAERRELERLREVAQREPVRAELVLERGAVHAGLDPRRARLAVDLEHPVERAEVDADRAAVVVVDVALDAADHRRAAAVGDRRDRVRRCTSRGARRCRASSRGIATRSGGCEKSRCSPRHTSRNDLP